MSRTLSTTARQALGREPGTALGAIRRLRLELDEVEGIQVANALAAGWSWARIGRALGVTRQAVHRKYAHRPPATVAQPAPVFTTGLSVALMLARTEASARGDALVGSEHLLLGILQQGDGAAATALRQAGASLRALRDAVDALAPSDLCAIPPSQISLTSRAAAAVERATTHAIREAAARVTDVHLLRALIESPGSGAVAALCATHVSPASVALALPVPGSGA